jgi:MGT family glycosyltransferase
MARILFTCWPVPGHYFPLIAVALALRARGNDCVFYTGTRAAATLEHEGFSVFPFRALDEERVDKILFSDERRATHPAGARSFTALLKEWMLDTLPGQVQDIEQVINEWRPDVIASDPAFWAPMLVLREKLGIPVAISSFIPACMVPGPEAPPFGLGLPRPKGLWTRLLARTVTMGQSYVASDFRKAANDIRTRYGLAPLKGTVLAHSGTVSLYMVPSVPEFDYERRDLPASVQYVGPYLWNRPQSAPPPEWFSRLRGDRPWVHVTEGTVHVTEPVVLRAATHGLADLPMEVILTTGSDRNPEELNLGRIAPNVHVGRWISHSDLLPHTAVMVTTGGAGSVLAGLSAGVPLIVVPTEWDKPENAQRVVEAGAGLRLAPRRCNARSLRAAVEKVLSDDSFRRNAQRLARVFSSYGGAAKAAELLEGLSRRTQ